MANLAEIEAEIIEPMKALFRVPFGVDDPERALVEYTKVLTEFDAQALNRGWRNLVKIHKKRDWPSIATIREEVIAAAPMPPMTPMHSGSEGQSVHPSRLNPSPSMRVYPFMKSMLRTTGQWSKFLDRIHPSQEHAFFVQATLGRTQYEIDVPNDFRRDYIVRNWAKTFETVFDQTVSVRVNASHSYTQLPNVS